MSSGSSASPAGSGTGSGLSDSRILQKAAEVVYGPRRRAYGHPTQNHNCTATMWNSYLKRRFGVCVALTARDVCLLNILQKVSRDANRPAEDNLVDIAGYAENAALVEEPHGC